MVTSAFSRLKRPLFWVRFHKFYSLLLFIVMIVIGVFIYQKIALELNRLAFKNAQHAIDTVYADIVAQVGQPDNSKRSNTCNIVRNEFSSGPIYCFISIDFVYGLSSRQDADRLFNNIQKIVSLHPELFKVVKLTSSIDTTTIGNNIYQATHDSYIVNGLGCTFSYVYNTPKLTGLMIKDVQKKVFQISLGCSSKSRVAFYTLEN